MTARLLDGKALAQTMQAETAAAVADFVRRTGVQPGLATVLVGDNAASQTYVRNKRRACEKAGMVSRVHDLPATTSQAQLLSLLGQLNADAAVHGILVQLPLPSHIDESVIVDAVAPLKDVDGFGPVSLGLLTAGRPRYLACTPHGIVQLLRRNDVAIAGRHVVVVGRSNIVGKPLALLLLHKGTDATVTVCHSRTPDVGAIARSADVVVTAIGQAHFLRANMVRPGAVVVDVGTNRMPDGRLTGDVDFEAVKEVASAITPVPGGVGPMTITMLLHNTLEAAKRQVNSEARGS
jgi:methylenetetrahydrofolate dehydrogenase (NADP+) / methenyltetrahydrofolate cyclohydrolase